MNKYKLDSWGVLYNDPINFKEIRDEVDQGKTICFQWTDQNGSMFTIIITRVVAITDQLSRGCRASDIFVSVLGFGCMGFSTNGSVLYSNYIKEKLGIYSDNFTELLNKIIRNE